MTIEKQTPLGELAAAHPLATRVFHRHGIKYCCSGGNTLEDVCNSKDLDVQTILDEITKELDSSSAEPEQWNDASFEDLIAHIIKTYHESLREELPRLEAMAQRVLHVHGDKMPQVLPELASVVTALKNELEQHMFKEEQILFPMILKGEGSKTLGPVECMIEEHQSAVDALSRLRELTNGFTVPMGACNTWQALWHGLAALETDLQEHIHLENNILFPRALKS